MEAMSADDLAGKRPSDESYLHDANDLGVSRLPALARMPVELLGDVFTTCLQNKAPGSTDICDYQLESFTLASVCQWWREVAIATPQVWSQIFIDFDKIVETAQAEAWATMLTCCLQRSASASLEIFVQCTSEKESLDAPFRQITLCLSQHMARCAYLRMRSLELSSNDNLISLLRGEFPRLWKLELVDTQLDEDTEVQLAHFNIFSGSPPLRLVVLNCAGSHVASMPSMDSVTRLTLHSPTPLEVDTALSKFPSVSVMRLAQPSRYGEEDIQPWICPNLVSLTVSSREVPPFGWLASLLTAPNLRQISLSGITGNFAARNVLLGKINPGATLESIEVSCVRATDGMLALVDTLRGYPRLVSLTFSRSSFLQSTLNELCSSLGASCEDGTWRNPRLQDLHFENCRFVITCDPLDVDRLVEARAGVGHDGRDGVRPFRAIVVRVAEWPSDSVIKIPQWVYDSPRMRQIQAQGFKEAWEYILSPAPTGGLS